MFLGTWDYVTYDSPETSAYMKKISGDTLNGDLGFKMGQYMNLDSKMEFNKDGTYRQYDNGEFGNPEDEGNMFKGTWKVNETAQTLILSLEYTDDTVLNIVSISPDRIELGDTQIVGGRDYPKREYPIKIVWLRSKE